MRVVGDERRDECRLADPRFARNQHHAPASTRRVPDRPVEHLPRLLALEERGRRDRTDPVDAHDLWRGSAVDRGDEPVATAVHGADDALLPTVVTDRSADGLDSRREGRLRDEARPPHLLQELLLRDHPIPVLEEVAQHVEHLGLDVHGFAVAT